MPRTAARGGPQTRAKIAATASALFLQRGFDAVTVTEIARAAGVSAVTVFNHFPRKEDLFLDRSEDAESLLRAAVAVADQPNAPAVIDALQESLTALVEARHPLTGLDPDSLPYFRTVAASPTLIARTRDILAELEHNLALGLTETGTPDLDSALLAAYLIAGYTAIFRRTAQHRLAGATPAQTETELRNALDHLFTDLRCTLPPGVPAAP